MAVSITDSQSTIESPIFVDDFEGIKRAKELLEKAMCKMNDLLESLIRAKEKKTGFAALNSDLVIVRISIWSLSLCHLALDKEEDDSDEEASDPDSDDYGDEHMECEDADTGSMSDSLCSTLATSEMRSRLDSNRGIKRAKLVLEQVLCMMMRECTRILERETQTRTVGHIPWFIPLGCICILLICYHGLDSEDDSDEEESEINPDESSEAATEDECFESEGHESVEQEERKQPSANQISVHIAKDTDSQSDSLSSIALSQTGTRNKRKRCRAEEPCLVKRTKGENHRT